MHPCAAAIGEYFLEVSPPAEKIAKSKPSSKECSFSSLTVYSFPKKLILFPADLLEAKNTYSEIGKFFSSYSLRAVIPTRPVAPTKANLYFFIIFTPKEVLIINKMQVCILFTYYIPKI